MKKEQLNRRGKIKMFTEFNFIRREKEEKSSRVWKASNETILMISSLVSTNFPVEG